MSKSNGKIELARSVVERFIRLGLENNTSYSKRFIASVLKAENPNEFTDIEHARKVIRLSLGATGTRERSRASVDLSRRFALMGTQAEELRNFSPFVIPEAASKTLAIADLHSKFCDMDALKIAIENGIKEKCNSVIIDGDFMDFYGFSRFDKSPMTVEKFYDEQEWGVDVLSLLQECFGRVYLKLGNHDLRRQLNVEKMAAQFPELYNLASYNNYLSFEGSKVQFIEDYNHIVYGKLNIIHGHEYQGGGGIHVAHNRLAKTMDNTLSAHSHKAQSTIRTNINGEAIGSWALGSLCDLHPRYNPKNDWNHGFAILSKSNDGFFEVQNKVIMGNKIFNA